MKPSIKQLLIPPWRQRIWSLALLLGASVFQTATAESIDRAVERVNAQWKDVLVELTATPSTVAYQGEIEQPVATAWSPLVAQGYGDLKIIPVNVSIDRSRVTYTLVWILEADADPMANQPALGTIRHEFVRFDDQEWALVNVDTNASSTLDGMHLTAQRLGLPVTF